MQSLQGKAFNAANVTKGVKQLSESTGKMFQNNFETGMQWINDMQNVLGSMGLNLGQKKDDCCDACPPHCECPPHCLISITRNATVGEIIIVPFKVKNTLQTAKVYKVGVRPIYDNDGNAFPLQPVLNKTDLNLQPGQSILVEMRVIVGNGYTPGTYSTEIVIREKDVNQNICFTLNVTANTNIPEAHPRKEEDYFNHFQDWKSHYYCDRKPTITRVTGNLDVNLNPVPAGANPNPAPAPNPTLSNNAAGTPK